MSNIIKLEIVEKYNPYHDSKGRFTSAGNATSFTIGSKSGLEWDKKNVQRAIDREKKRTAGGNSDGDAKRKQAEDDLRGVLKDGAVVNFAGMDADLAQETTGTIKRVIEKYPSCKDAFGGFTTEEPEPGYFEKTENKAMACCSKRTGVIYLNKVYYGNKDEFSEKIAESIEKGFHPKGVGYDSVVVHEMGHAINEYVSKVLYDSYDYSWMGKRCSTEIWDADIKKYRKNLGLKKDEPLSSAVIRESLSGYASKNHNEYLAEGFSEALCSSNPRPTAKSIAKRLENRINKAEKLREEGMSNLGGWM